MKTKSQQTKPAANSIYIVGISAFIVGLIVASTGWYLYNNETIRLISSEIKPLRQKNNPYTYINPLLGYETPGNVKEFNKYQPIVTNVDTAVAQANNSNLTDFSIYFRDLTSGRWSGQNENISYSPGSMMKVGIMIAYFKEAEDNPEILNETLPYTKATVDEANNVPFSDTSSLNVGQSYTVEQLIEAMIINSDNGAKNVLLDNIDKNSFVEVHTDLGLPNPLNPTAYTISAKQYSVLLRILYNATYLDRADSEKALEIMSKATYNQGLVAGVPQGTLVAQKFGEAIDAVDPQQANIDLSDCGIVYQKTNPYILCVMTKGKTIDALTKTIATISKTVWDTVQSYSGTQ